MTDATTNIQIEKCIERHRCVSRQFAGCVGADKLFKHQTPFSFIVNFDKHSEPGSHWIAIHVPYEDTVEYFDSFGREPPAGPIQRFVNSFKTCIINRQSFQSPLASVCGHYCVYFITQRALGIPFQTIISRLSKLNQRADEHVKTVFCTLAGI